MLHSETVVLVNIDASRENSPDNSAVEPVIRHDQACSQRRGSLHARLSQTHLKHFGFVELIELNIFVAWGIVPPCSSRSGKGIQDTAKFGIKHTLKKCPFLPESKKEVYQITYSLIVLLPLYQTGRIPDRSCWEEVHFCISRSYSLRKIFVAQYEVSVWFIWKLKY